MLIIKGEKNYRGLRIACEYRIQRIVVSGIAWSSKMSGEQTAAKTKNQIFVDRRGLFAAK
jgi:hypothetical protein